MGTHFIYPLSPKGGYYFETPGGKALPITPDNYWAVALKGEVDTWGLSTGFRILGPGDWVWAYFSLPTAQILGVGTVISPVSWNMKYGRHAVDIQWDAALTEELKRNPIDYARYQQQVQASAVRANARTKAVLDAWLAQRGSKATQAHRGVEFATREVRQRLGQGGFRSTALRAYQNVCAITGCGETGVLQAAHILPVGMGGSHNVSNAVLLRADLHNLFDLGRVYIRANLTVAVEASVKEQAYRRLDGTALRTPSGVTKKSLSKQFAAHRRIHGK